MMKRLLDVYFGKYREIVLAVAFFLVFDLAVLVLNFLISFQISTDTAAVNLGGRQRMLSQRMTKSLYAVNQDVYTGGAPSADSIKELGTAATLFDATLEGFRHGGTVTGGDGHPTTVAPVGDAKSLAILDQAEPLWERYHALLDPVVGGDASPDQLVQAVAFARENNLRLLTLMNDLTTQLEATARGKAEMLRAVQTIGILLALANFGFILVKFIRRLRENDRRVEAAQRETTEILGTVREGLLLLDTQLRVGSQLSQSLPKILGRPVQSGMDFRQVLRTLLPPDLLQPAIEYMELLLEDRVQESLVVDLNPLTQVEVRNLDDASRKRHLALYFNRAIVEGRISHLLVTVVDISAQIELAAALTDARRKAKAEVEVMLDLLSVEPAVMNQFLDSAEKKLLQVNDLLRSAGGQADFRRTIAAVLRLMHAIKGDAAALGLDIFEVMAQEFEAMLSSLRDRGAVSGDDLLGLPLPLDDFFQRVTLVRELMRRALKLQAREAAPPLPEFTVGLDALAQRIAKDHGKRIRLVTELDMLPSLPTMQSHHIQDITLQLLRNAVVHGIEPVEERQRRDKPAEGEIYVGLKATAEGDYQLVVRDDGYGLSPDRVREALIRSGRYTRAHLSEFSDRQVLMKLFESGVSTAEKVSRDAGHGIGLDLVTQKIQQLRSRLRVATREHLYTEFSFRFTPQAGA